MKKILGLFSLIILLFTEVITPVTYALEGEESSSSEVAAESSDASDSGGDESDADSGSDDSGSDDDGGSNAGDEADADDNSNDSDDENNDSDGSSEDVNDDSQENEDSSNGEENDATDGSESQDNENNDEGNDNEGDGSEDAEVSEIDELIESIDFSKSPASVANKLGIDWEKDAGKYAVLAGIEKEEYRGTPEQNEVIKQYFEEHAKEILSGEIVFEEEGTTPEEEVKSEESNGSGGSTGDTEKSEIDKIIESIDFSKSPAVVANKLGIDWEKEATKYAMLAGIAEDQYLGTSEQNELIKQYFEEHAREILEGQEQEEVQETVEDLTGLNKEEIVGEKTYDGVTVHVVAPIGSFEEGTELVITPITKKKELKEIEEKIINQQDNIRETTELLAFDISFIYEGEEKQPIEGKTVQVTFDYKENKKLSDTDNNDSQELKIYHLDDKDGNGNKVDEIEVKEVTVNEQESEEGMMVVNVESFSIYAIVINANNVQVACVVDVANDCETMYATLKEAVINAPDGGIVQLINDLSIDTMITLDKTITINLNGYKINNEGETGSVFQVVNDATLTIDGSVEGSSFYGRLNAGIANNNNGNIVLSGGNYSVGNNQTVLHINGTCLNSNVTIKNAIVTSPTDNGIQLNGKGIFLIENSKIIGATAVYIKSGNLTVKNSTLKGTMQPVNYDYRGNGAWATGDGIVVDSCEYPGGAPSITFVGGNYANDISGTKNAIGYYEYDGNNDGNTSSAYVLVEGGIFSSDPTAFVADGKYVIAGEGIYSVSDTLTSVDGNYVATPNTEVKGIDGVSTLKDLVLEIEENKLEGDITTQDSVLGNDADALGEVILTYTYSGNQLDTVKFGKTIMVKVPVKDASIRKAFVKIKHGNDPFGIVGLATQPDTCDDNGVAQNYSYTGGLLDVINGYVTIYTCQASTVALLSNQYIVEFDKMGGEGGTNFMYYLSGDPEGKYYANKSRTQLINPIVPPTKTGNVFLGYKTEKQCNGDFVTDESGAIVYDINGNEAKNLEYYACWSRNDYDLVVNTGSHATYDNVGTSENNKYDFGVEIFLKNPTAVDEGYSFEGWISDNDNVSFEGDPTALGGTTKFYMPDGNVTVTANIVPINYSIVYNLDGGSAENPETYTIESGFTLNNPVKEGYHFLGWTGTDITESVSGTVIIGVGSKGSREYTAKWINNTWDSEPISAGSTKVGNAYTFTDTSVNYSPVDTTNGRLWTGAWVGVRIIAPERVKSENIASVKFDKAGNTGIGNDSATAQSFDSAKDGTLSDGRYYVEVWVPLTDENVRSAILNNQTIYRDFSFYFEGEEANKQTFRVEIDPTNIVLTNTDDVEGAETIKIENGNEIFNVTFTTGDNNDVVVEVASGSLIDSASIPVITKIGHTISWKYNDTEFDFSTPISGDITLTGEWIPDEYTITFNPNNGSGTRTQEGIVYNHTGTVPANPTNNGFGFIGWTLNGESFDIETTPITGDITLIADWKANNENQFFTKGGTGFWIVLYDEDGKIDYTTTKLKNGLTTNQELAAFLFGEAAAALNSLQIAYLFNTTKAEIVNIPDLGGAVLFVNYRSGAEQPTKGFCSDSGCNYFASSTWTTTGVLPSMDTESAIGPTWMNGATNYGKYKEIEGKGYVVLASTGNVGGYIYVPYKEFTVDYSYQGAPYWAEGLPTSGTYKYKDIVDVASLPTAQGYTFTGWFLDGELTGSFSMPARDVVLTGEFLSNDLNYSCHYELETLEGNWVKTGTDILLNGKEGDAFVLPTSQLVTFPGFSLTGTYDNYVIRSGYSIPLKYARNKYVLEYAYETEVPGASALPLSGEYKYEEEVPVAPVATASGYDFTWNTGASIVMPANDVVIIGTFTPRNDTEYKVRYYFENENKTSWVINNSLTQTLTGTTEGTASVTAPEFSGFTYNVSKSSPSKEIEGSGATVLRLYYDRNLSTITFVDGSGVKEDVIYTGNYDTDLPGEFPAWSRTGYIRTWSETDLPAKFPAEDMTVTATWTPKNLDYRFMTHYQRLKDDDYGKTNIKPGDYISGAVAQVVEIPLAIEGMHLNPIAPNTTDPYCTVNDAAGVCEYTIPDTDNGQINIHIYYDRDLYTVSFDSDGGEAVHSVTVKYGYTFTGDIVSSKTGYDFSGWKLDDQIIENLSGFKVTFTGDKELVAQWAEREDTDYTVKYYWQNIDNDKYTQTDTENLGLTGRTDSEISIDPEEFSGFAFNAALSTTGGTISASGDLVLDLYYDRLSYPVSYALTEEISDPVEGMPASGDVKYGATVTVEGPASATGYTFTGWFLNGEPTGSFVMPAEAVELTGAFTAKKVSYKYHYEIEDLDGNFVPSAEEARVRTGTAGKLTTSPEEEALLNYIANSYPGFELSGTINDYRETIKGDGTTDIAIQLKRKEYNVSYVFENADSLSSEHSDLPISGDYKYEHTVTVAPLATASGYTFVWSGYEAGGTFPMPAEDVVITGRFIPAETTYKVEYYYQGDDGLYAMSGDAVVRTGITDTSVAVEDDDKVASDLEHYIFDETNTENVLSGDIRGDGDLTLKLYFKKQLKVRYLPGDEGKFGEEDFVYTGLDYGTSTPNLPVSANILDHTDGFIFDKWSPEWSDTVTGDVTYVALWTPGTSSYTVEHYQEKLEGGYELIETDSLTGDTKTPVVGTPNLYSGFTFSGDVEGSVLTGDIKGDGSLVLKLYYPRDTYNLKYVTQFVDPDTVPLKYGATIELPDISRTGHILNGWYNVPADGKMPASDWRISPKWLTGSYSIEFNTNGGTIIPTITGDYESVIPSVSDPEKDGYTFSGWDIAIPATMPGNDLTITAEWTIENYDIDYELNSGSVDGVNPTGYTVESGAITLINPIRDSYEFVGWSGTDLAGSGNQAVSIAAGSTGNRNYEANWKAEEYTITFDVDGGDAIAPLTYTIESGYDSLPETSRTGYQFTGWFDVNDTLVEAVPTGTTGDISLKAHWIPLEANYQVTHYKEVYSGYNGTKIQIGDKWYKVDSSKTLTGLVNTPVSVEPKSYSGFTFDTSAANVTTGDVVADGSLELVLYYSRNVYKVTFNTNGGTDIADQNVGYFMAIEEPEDPTKTGFTFKEWQLDGVPFTSWNQLNVAGDIQLDAVWDENNYTIDFDTTGASGSIDSITTGYTAVFELPNPSEDQLSKTGYTFTGWSVDGGDVEYTGGASVSGLADTGSITLYPVWEAKEYTITWLNSDDSVITTSGYNYDTLPVLGFDPVDPRDNIKCTFSGWNIEIAKVTGNAEYKAEYKGPCAAAQYTVTWLNSDESVIKLDQVAYGDSIAYSGDVPTSGLDAQYSYVFTGWRLSGDNEILKETVTPVTGDITYIAAYDAIVNNYVVTFVYTGSDGAAVTETGSYAYGTLSGDLVVPTTTGYEDTYNTYNFSGWTPALDTVTGDITYTADYTPVEREYIVTWNAGEETTTGGYSYRAGLSVPANPTMTGYSFVSWEPQDNAPAAVNGIFVEGNYTYLAQWNANPYKIQFNANGGNGVATYQDMVYDQTGALNANTFTREGYEFTGWAETKNGAVKYADGEEVINLATTGVVALYAQRNPLDYTVTYNVNSGTMPDTYTGTYSILTGIDVLAEPTRVGYVFSGWFDNEELSGDKITSISVGLTGDKVFWAKWSPITYTIVFDKNETNAEGTLDNIIAEYDSGFVIPEDGYIWTGHSIIEWNTQADGSGDVIALGSELKNLTTTGGDVITLYAQWSPMQYIVNFDGNSGAGVMSGQLFTAGVKQALSKNLFEKTGYVFMGWSTKQSSSAAYVDEQEIVVNLGNKTSITLYAQWNPITYTLVYEAGEGTGDAFEEALTYDVEHTLTGADAFNKSGYTFSGWKIGDEEYVAGSGVTNLTATSGGVITAVAQWAANEDTPYNVEFYYQVDGAYSGVADTTIGRTGTTDTEVSVTEEDKVPTQSGYALDADAANIFTGIVASDNSLALKLYFKKQYTVEYATGDHGDFEGTVTTGLDYGTGTPAEPVIGAATGYEFAGWSPATGATVTGDVVYVAQWSPITYKLVYEAGEGTGDSFEEALTYDVEHTLTGADAFNKSGYTFSGWKIGNDVYAAGSGVMNLATTSGATEKAIAQWAANEDTPYNVEFYYQVDGAYSGVADTTIGRTGTTDTEVSVTEEDKVPTQSGYALDADAANIFTGIVASDNSLALKLYFKKQYTVEYATGDHGAFEGTVTTGLDYGTGTPAAPAITAGTGYEFAGWNPATGATVTGDVVYVAQWSPITYKLVYEAGEGTGDSFEEALTYDVEHTLTGADAFNKSGYTFSGWKIGNDVYAAGSGVMNLATTSGAVVTGIAQWIANEVTLTFDVDGVKTTLTGLVDSPLSVQNPEKGGYTFAGWDPALPSTFPTSDTTYTATWSRNPSSGGGGSSRGGGGGGGGSSKTSTDNTPTTGDVNNDTDNNTVNDGDKEDLELNNNEGKELPVIEPREREKYGDEMVEAYLWAYKNGIVSVNGLDKLKPNDPLTRGELAKMMVKYVSLVLGKSRVKTDVPYYPDVTRARLGDIADFIRLAYQYQIMGIHANGKALRRFNPNTLVSRGEFVTVFSRVLYGSVNNKDAVDYYANHMIALSKAGILKNTNPTIKELRGWVMLMMYRSAQK